MRSTTTKRRPQAEVKAALIEAGISLFAERGIAAVTVRDLAAAANVNHSMLFRYFGNKDGLVEAVFQTIFERMGMVEEPTDTFGEEMLGKSIQAIIETPQLWRLLTYAVLDDRISLLRKIRSPYMQETVKRLAQRQADGAIIDDIDPRVLLTSGMALGLGWLVFENLLNDMAGLKAKDRRWVKQQIDELWAHTLRAD